VYGRSKTVGLGKVIARYEPFNLLGAGLRSRRFDRVVLAALGTGQDSCLLMTSSPRVWSGVRKSHSPTTI